MPFGNLCFSKLVAIKVEMSLTTLNSFALEESKLIAADDMPKIVPSYAAAIVPE